MFDSSRSSTRLPREVNSSNSYSQIERFSVSSASTLSARSSLAGPSYASQSRSSPTSVQSSYYSSSSKSDAASGPTSLQKLIILGVLLIFLYLSFLRGPPPPFPFPLPHSHAIDVEERLQHHHATAATSNSITLHFVPHSHLDAGWLRTFDDYYAYPGKSIVSAIAQGLARATERRFVWADLSFLLRWLEEESSKPLPDEALLQENCALAHEEIRHCLCGSGERSVAGGVSNLHLLACVIYGSGQLELVSGSYTAQDSATSTPLERIEGFQYGRCEWKKWERKLLAHVKQRRDSQPTNAASVAAIINGAERKHIPVRPFAIAYEIDQFGHSGSEPAISAGLDFSAIVLGRTEHVKHATMKRERAREFWWTQRQATFMSEDSENAATAAAAAEEETASERESQVIRTRISAAPVVSWREMQEIATVRPIFTSVLHDHYSSPVCLKDLQYSTLRRSGDPSQSLYQLLRSFAAYVMRDRLHEKQTSHGLVLLGDDFRYVNVEEVNRFFDNVKLVQQALGELIAKSQKGQEFTTIPSNVNEVVSTPTTGGGGSSSSTQKRNWRDLLTEQEETDLLDVFRWLNIDVQISSVGEYLEHVLEEDALWRLNHSPAPITPVASNTNVSSPAAAAAAAAASPSQALSLIPSPSLFPAAPDAVAGIWGSNSLDFFPYSDKWFDNVWVGYYGNIPYMKFRNRKILARRRSVAAAAASALLRLKLNTDTSNPINVLMHEEKHTQVVRIAHALNDNQLFAKLLLALHHDGLTGTHRIDVRRDYLQTIAHAEKRLTELTVELERAMNRDPVNDALFDPFAGTNAAAADSSTPSAPSSPFLILHPSALGPSGLLSLPRSHRPHHHEPLEMEELEERSFQLDISPLFVDEKSVSESTIQLQLFNGLGYGRHESMLFSIRIDCAMFPFIHSVGFYPALLFSTRESDESIDYLTLQYPTRHSLHPLQQCTDQHGTSLNHVSGDQTKFGGAYATFDLHVAIKIRPLSHLTIYIQADRSKPALPTNIDAAKVAMPSDAATNILWSSNGREAVVKGTSIDLHLSFHSVDGQLSYSVAPVANAEPTAEGVKVEPSDAPALTFRHSHYVYLSSTRAQCNSGAYLFRSLFPTPFAFLMIFIGAGWLLSFILTSLFLGFARRSLACLQTIGSSFCTSRASRSSASNSSILPVNINGGRKPMDLSSVRSPPSSTVLFLNAVQTRGNWLYDRLLHLVALTASWSCDQLFFSPIIAQFIIGATLASFFVLAILESSFFISHDTLLYLLNPASNVLLCFLGGVVGLFHAVFMVLIKNRGMYVLARDPQWRSKGKKSKIEDHSDDSDRNENGIFANSSAFIFTPHSAAAASRFPPRFILSTLLFALGFAASSIMLFVAFPSFQARVLHPSELISKSAPISRQFVEPTFRVDESGPLFTEFSHSLSSGVSQSVRVYHLPQPLEEQLDSNSRIDQFVAWQNGAVNYRWSIAPCADCQLASRVDLSVSTRGEKFPPATSLKPSNINTNKEDAAANSSPASTVHSATASFFFLRWYSQISDSISSVWQFLVDSSSVDLFFTDDGLTVMARQPPRFSMMLPQRYVPMQQSAAIFQQADVTSTEVGNGFIFVSPSHSMGVSRLNGALEVMHQRWLSMDDEKGLDSGVMDSQRWKLSGWLVPQFATASARQRPRYSHLCQSKAACVRVSRRLFQMASQNIVHVAASVQSTPLFLATASNPAGSKPKPTTNLPPLTAVAHLPSSVSLDSISLLDSELALHLLPAPPSAVSPATSFSQPVMVALRLLNHSGNKQILTKKQLCQWIEATQLGEALVSDSGKAYAGPARRRLSCPVWHRSNLAFDRLLLQSESEPSGLDAKQQLALAASKLTAIVIWVRIKVLV